MKIQFLIENKTEKEGILAQHGLSVWIEAAGKKILFDAGATDAFAANARRMQVDLAEADLAVVSHGHYDHTGGFPAFCRINGTAPVYIHRNAFRKSYGLEEGKLEEVTCGIRWTDQELEDLRDRLVYTDGLVTITPDIVISGTVPYAEGTVPTETFYYYDDDGQLTPDDMSHEQILVIRESKGIYVFSGCSHRGVISALKAARQIFPGEPVAALVAGMHLYGASAVERENVIAQLKMEETSKILPVHCTGIRAICDLKQAFGDDCLIGMAGDVFREL